MQSLRKFVFFLFLLINFNEAIVYQCNSNYSCGCSSVTKISVSARIVGGEASENHAFGWMVSFQRNNVHLCGASLLTAEYAITAAHCVDGIVDFSSYSILAGTHNLEDTGNPTVQRRVIQKAIVHPNYRAQGFVNDIALVQFAPLSTESSSKISFICLPKSSADIFKVNDSAIAIGWGVTEYNGKEVPKYLQQVSLKIFSSTSAECLRSSISDASVQFCAAVYGGGKDTCQGDSGGPLMSFYHDRWILSGLTSSGYGCAFSGYTGLYTRISSFITFIESYINISQLQPADIENYTDISVDNNNNDQTSTLQNNQMESSAISMHFYFISYSMFLSLFVAMLLQ